MTGSHKRYDSKHRVTRIFLSDYQALKAISQQAGISMAEALHKLIIRERESMIAFQVRSHPIIVTNGNRPIYARPRSELRLQVRAKGVIDGQG